MNIANLLPYSSRHFFNENEWWMIVHYHWTLMCVPRSNEWTLKSSLEVQNLPCVTLGWTLLLEEPGLSHRIRVPLGSEIPRFQHHQFHVHNSCQRQWDFLFLRDGGIHIYIYIPWGVEIKETQIIRTGLRISFLCIGKFRGGSWLAQSHGVGLDIGLQLKLSDPHSNIILGFHHNNNQ